MKPELFHLPIFGIPIYGYGVAVVIGFLAASYFARWLANRSGLDGEAFVNAALLALVTGIVGARLSHILENPGEFFRSDRGVWETLVNMVNLRSGGLTYYGGFLLAFPTLVWYGIKKKIPLAVGMDIVAPALMIALGFGRVGCFLNGCCHGAVCPDSFPLAVHFPYHSNAYIDQFQDPVTRDRLHTPEQFIEEGPAGTPRLKPPAEIRGEAKLAPPGTYPDMAGVRSLPVHPAQLYSTATAFLLAGLLTAYYTLPHIAGRGFALMLVLEGSSRFLLELLRTEPAVAGRSFSLSMIISIGLVFLGLVLWLIFGRLGHRVKPAAPAAGPMPPAQAA
jgi:phosphatidylglycerol---prolipoprotein diacylglyceryl transferase